jgi:pSer/pThr/pTyr-binding forkhead associated (FHA) protein
VVIRITHLSGSQKGTVATSGKPAVRIGRGADCDVRFDGAREPKVSTHHAEFLYEDGCWFVVDTASTNGTLIDGRRVLKHQLRQGEEVQLGSGGPLVKVEFDAKEGRGGTMKTEAIRLDSLEGAARIDATSELERVSKDLQQSADTATAQLAELAAKHVAEERARAEDLRAGR